MVALSMFAGAATASPRLSVVALAGLPWSACAFHTLIDSMGLADPRETRPLLLSSSSATAQQGPKRSPNRHIDWASLLRLACPMYRRRLT